jgi:hypothetical protein
MAMDSGYLISFWYHSFANFGKRLQLSGILKAKVSGMTLNIRRPVSNVI